ncbi:MAG: chrO [Betaproteobacteria bacterium]|nr:chrO [Betaproteobacteria bacterium]
MKRLLVHIIATLCCAHAGGIANAADAFKRLDAAAIRMHIAGKVITDGSHWSDRFAARGVFDAMELGQHKSGNWRIDGNDMCVTRKSRKPVEDGFEIWLAEERIEYRRDGVILTTAYLRKE